MIRTGRNGSGSTNPAEYRRSFHARWRRAAAVASAAVLTLNGCQSPPSDTPQPDRARINRTGGYLEYRARVRDQDQKSKVGTGDTSHKESVVEENLKLEFDGFLYHPNFFDFTLGGLFGLLQQDNEEVLDGRSRTAGEDGTALEFDLTGNFLKKKPYPGTVFARRNRMLQPRPFQSSLESTTTNFGLLWQYVDEKAPTSVQFSDTDILLHPLSGEEADGRQHNTTFRLETGYRFTEQNALSFVFSHQSVQEEPFAYDYDSDEATLSHLLNFGDADQHRLDSEFNLYDQRGTFETKRARWRETLRLEHSDSLHSWYIAEALKRKQGSLSGVTPIDETSYLASGTLEHKWYESLVSQLYGFGQTQDFATGPKIDRLGGQVSLDYRKKNQWGVLHADYRFRLQQEKRSAGMQSLEMIDERHTFRDPDPITLTGTSIDIGTIRITAEDQVTLYQSGRDYSVDTFADRIEIRRVPTGRITDGQTVLFDYISTLGGSFNLDTATHAFGMRQIFEFGLTPYYRLRRQDQTISPVDATEAVAEDITAHVIGAEYDRMPFRLTAELEDHTSNINPFKAVRLGASFTRKYDFGGTLSLSSRWSDVEQSMPVREIKFLTLEGRYRHAFTKNLNVEGAVMFRDENDSLGRSNQGVDVDLSLEWTIRQTEVRVTYEWNQFEDNFAENQSTIFFLQVRRRF